MEVIRTVPWMKEAARQVRAENHLVGLVPTMGALHEGHLALVRRARRECSRVLVSVFVNPKQFGPNEDLSKYPRSLESDAAKLEAAGVDLLFAPGPEEIYPPGFATFVTVEGIGERLEGRTRPGHFRGVATVLAKLFQIVQPNFAYFGRKDAQQARLVSQMAGDLNLDVQPVVCAIVREADGLALSSRNAYLNPDERRAATVLYRALDRARQEIAAGARGALEIREEVRRILTEERLARVDYAEVVDADSFEPVARLGGRAAYVLLAVFIGGTRLIDNLLVEPDPASDRLIVTL
jgi:pantoate--beta-alanine ligase